MNSQEWIATLEQMLALLKSGAPVPMPTPTYPRTETFVGAQFYLKAPLNPNWQPSQYARMFGQRMILQDPSNAESGQPLRSPAGYPLVYLIPGKPARVLYGESTFKDDAEVEHFRAAAAASQAGAEQRDKDEGNVFRTPGEVEVRVEQG